MVALLIGKSRVVQNVAAASRRLVVAYPRAADLALGLTMTLVSSVYQSYEPVPTRPPDRISFLLTVVTNLPLAVRRRAPVAVLVVSCSGAFLFHGLGYYYNQDNMGPLLALYTVAAHRPLWPTFASWVLTVAEWTYALAPAPYTTTWSVFGQSMVVCTFTSVIGAGVRQRDERNRRLADLSEDLRRERAAAERRAIMDERVGIARELHDIVAHHMAVISIQAGLGRYVASTDPATAEAALGAIAETSSEGLAELRRLLSILRVDGDVPPDEESAGSVHLDAMLHRMRSAGLPIELTLCGERRPLPTGLDLPVYRILQEALTNVMKHAGSVPTTVTLDHRGTTLVLRVENQPPSQPLPALETSGLGLVGMTERVRLFGGSIQHGPTPAGGFALTAVFPLDDCTERVA
jgi:signal transduction histidine kinase